MRRVEVPPTIAATESPDYASAFALTVSGPDARRRSAEEWARVVFEGAPPLMRSCIVFGWRFVLGLHVEPAAADRVLGWSVSSFASEPDTVTLAANSRLLAAENIVAVDATVVLWVTVVRYESRLARPFWFVAAKVHHLTIPFLLGRAARESSAEAGSVFVAPD